MTFYLLIECGRFGILCGRFSLWPFSFVTVLDVTPREHAKERRRVWCCMTVCDGRTTGSRTVGLTMSGWCVNMSTGWCSNDEMCWVVRCQSSFNTHHVTTVKPQVVDDVVTILHQPHSTAQLFKQSSNSNSKLCRPQHHGSVILILALSLFNIIGKNNSCISHRSKTANAKIIL